MKQRPVGLIAKNLLQYFPLPTDPTQSAGRTNFVGNLPQNSSDNTHLLRIDHAFSDKDRLMGRYIWFGGSTLSAGTLPTNSTSNTPGSQNLALTETHTFSPTFFLEGRAGFSRNTTNFQVAEFGFNAIACPILRPKLRLLVEHPLNMNFGAVLWQMNQHIVDQSLSIS